MAERGLSEQQQAKFEDRLLGQLRPGNTTAVSIYSPPTTSAGIIDEVMVANTTAITANFSIFLDNDGTTFDEATAIFFKVKLEGNSTLSWTPADGRGVKLNNPTANLAVKTETASAITFSVFGREKGR